MSGSLVLLFLFCAWALTIGLVVLWIYCLLQAKPLKKKQADDPHGGPAFDGKFEGEYETLLMVERAVVRSLPRWCHNQERWAAVKDTFGYGRNTSINLCRHFGLDPFEALHCAKSCRCDETEESHENKNNNEIK
jgi:hypothetical protein